MAELPHHRYKAARLAFAHGLAPGKGTVTGTMPAVARHRVACTAQDINASRASVRSSPVVLASASRQAPAAPSSSTAASFIALGASVTGNGRV